MIIDIQISADFAFIEARFEEMCYVLKICDKLWMQQKLVCGSKLTYKIFAI